MNTQKEIAEQYQGLFNLMSNQHGLTLTTSEMNDIIIEAQKVVNKINYLNNQHHETIPKTITGGR